jgi:hypothetical protein
MNKTYDELLEENVKLHTVWSALKADVEAMVYERSSKKVIRFCKRMLSDWSYFMSYLRNPDGPMTNKSAEEALRSLVIARKLCFGSRSEYGRQWRASLQNCTETLRRHGHSVLSFLTATIEAVRNGRPLPVPIPCRVVS